MDTPKVLGSLALLLVLSPGAVLAAAPSEKLFLVDTRFIPPTTRIYEVDRTTGVLTLRAELGETYSPVLAMAAADARTLYLAGTDTSPANLCDSQAACLLLKVVLDDDSTVPQEVEEVGFITTGAGIATSFTGLTFRDDGWLYGHSQVTDSLYRIDTASAQADLIGPMGLDFYGGDTTFAGGDQLWAWNNLDGAEGLYSLDPLTAHATPYEIHPFLDFAGLAGLGHGSLLYGASVVTDRIYPLDLAAGLGSGTLMLFGGFRFDHSRGDLDSPYCDDDASCADSSECTSDSCTPGGCRHEAIPGCCLFDADCDDGNACTLEVCSQNRCVSHLTPSCAIPTPEDPGPVRTRR
jgi:hypothetical protein